MGAQVYAAIFFRGKVYPLFFVRILTRLKMQQTKKTQDVLRLVRPLAKAVGVKDVVFGTDGTDLLEEAHSYNGTDLTIRTNSGIKRAVDGSDCLRESVVGCTPGLKPEDVRFALLLDLEALSNCKYFVGTVSLQHMGGFVTQVS